MSDATEKKYEDLVYVEAKLLEQEHRPIHLALNYVRRKKKWPDEDDPRRKAAQKAIFLRLFFSPAVLTAGGGGLIALLTLFFLSRQNTIIEKQNELLTEQNKKIEIQANLEEAGRRNNLVLLMDNILQQVGEELRNPENKDSIISEPLIARIAALSQGLQPYKFLDYKLRDRNGNDSLGLTQEYSPERGQLLVSLANSPIGKKSWEKIKKKSEFRYSYLAGVDLSHTDLSSLNLAYVDLSNADLTFTNLSRVSFFYSKLRNVNMSESRARSIYIRNSDMSYSYIVRANFDLAEFTSCDLTGIHLDQSVFSSFNFGYSNFEGAYLKDLKIRDGYNRPIGFKYFKDSLRIKGVESLEKKYEISFLGDEYYIFKYLKKE